MGRRERAGHSTPLALVVATLEDDVSGGLRRAIAKHADWLMTSSWIARQSEVQRPFGTASQEKYFDIWRSGPNI
jgi:hypothetical protein